MTVLEAMACGCPTITSNLSSLPEVVGDAALLIRPDDSDEICTAMRQLLDNSDLSDRLRQASVDRSKKFSWIKAARRVIETLEEIAT